MIQTDRSLTDPFASQAKPRRKFLTDGDASPPLQVMPAPRRASVFMPAFFASLLAAGAALGIVYFASVQPASSAASIVEVKPTHDVLVAIKDISRLEVTEVQVEKVVDLADKQKLFFDLVPTEDAMLLVAAGSATVGVDLEKLETSDVKWDEESRTAKLRLPAPQVLSTRLDEEGTYVYKRETGLLAKRNEHLESRGRKEAIKAVERAANEPDVMTRAKKQAERQLTALLTQLGAKRVEITWKD